MQTLPGKTFLLWHKSCEPQVLCPVAGAWGTAPVLPTLSTPTPVLSAPPQAQLSPEPPPHSQGMPGPEGSRDCSRDPPPCRNAGLGFPPSAKGHAPSQPRSRAAGLRTPTWTWSSRKRRWKSRGSAVRVAGPTSASTPTPPPQPPRPLAPASSGATLPALPSTRPGLNTLTGPAILRVKHLPWLGTEQGMDLGRPAPCPGAQPAPESSPRHTPGGPSQGELQTQHPFLLREAPSKAMQKPIYCLCLPPCPAPAIFIQTQCFC